MSSSRRKPGVAPRGVMPTVRTLAEPVHHVMDKVQGSRFEGDAAPVPDEAAALAFVDTVRARFPDASHHCWAFRFGPDRVRSSDDGEPGGTAGEPIAKRLAGEDLVGVVVVVTRWFGGTKLGMGGLVRAYGGCASETLAAVEIVETDVTQAVSLTFDYGLTGAVDSVLTAHGLVPIATSYDAEVHYTLAVRVEDVDAVREDLTERTAGRIRID